jgi:hypothetical protein
LGVMQEAVPDTDILVVCVFKVFDEDSSQFWIASIENVHGEYLMLLEHTVLSEPVC